MGLERTCVEIVCCERLGLFTFRSYKFVSQSNGRAAQSHGRNDVQHGDGFVTTSKKVHQLSINSAILCLDLLCLHNVLQLNT